MRRDRMTRRFGRATFGAVAAALVCAVVLVAAPQLAAMPNAVPGLQAAMSSGDVLGPIAPDPQPEGSSWLPADAADETQVKTDADGTAYEAGVALVKIAEGADAAQLSHAIAQTGLAADASIAPDEAARSLAAIELAPGVDEQQAAEAFANLEGAAFSQPNFVYYLDDAAQANGGTSASSEVIPPMDDVSLTTGVIDPGLDEDAAAGTEAGDDPMRSYQQGYLDAIHAPEAWDFTDSLGIADHSVTVAVIDTGLEMTHPEFQNGTVVATYDAFNAVNRISSDTFFDYGYHGTHVAGIIAATEGNGVGVAGVGHNKVAVLPIRVFGSATTNSNYIYEAYQFILKNAATYNIRAANMSLGGLASNIGSRDRAVVGAVADAKTKGVLTLCAGGNKSTSSTYWPVDYVDGMGVIALSTTFTSRASYSNFNAPGLSTKQISAPGTSIYNTVSQSRSYSGYASLSGTSMATPVVAGIAALVSAANPSLSPDEVRDLLISTATDIWSRGFDTQTGYGRVNEYEAVRKAAIGKALADSAAGSRQNVGSGSGDSGSEAAPYIVLGLSSQSYTGAKITPSPLLIADGRMLVEGTDYKLTYSKNINVGTATMKITGKGDFAGKTISTTFDIVPAIGRLRLESQAASAGNIVVTGWKSVIQKDAGATAKQSIKLMYGDYKLKANRDYKLTYSDNTASDSSLSPNAKLTIELMGSFRQVASSKGTAANPFTYKVYDPTLIALVAPERQTFNGMAQKPEPTVTYNGNPVDRKFYALTYADNVNAGTATVNVTGANGFAGESFGETSFTIARAKLVDAVVTGVSDAVYDGQPRMWVPSVTLDGRTLQADVDYKITYSTRAKSGKAGAAYVTVAGKGNYTGNKKTTFDIAKLDISGMEVSGLDGVVYDGAQKTPEPIVRVGGQVLEAGTDYKLAYGENIEPGVGSVTITGKTSCVGTRTVTFPIGKIDVASTAPTSISAKTYTGKALTTAPTLKLGEGEDAVELVKGVDYTVTHENNVNVGTARVIYTGIGEHFTGTKVVEFTIQPRKISSASMSGRKTSLAYTGAPVTQAITLKYGGIVLREGVDYRVTYADNVNVGTATMTITGLGNFDSVKTYTFKIK